MNSFQARETLLSLIPTMGLGFHLRIVPLDNIRTTKLEGLFLCQYAAKMRLPLEQLELLVAAGAAPDACTDPGDSPVAIYARNGELGQVCFLLTQGVPPEQAEAALLEAYKRGCVLIAHVLLLHCGVNYTCPIEAAEHDGRD